MKKVLCLIISLVLVLSVFAACGKNNNGTNTNPGNSSNVSSNENSMPFVLDQAEYTLYQNMFENDLGDKYIGKEVTKKGTFATLYDEYNKVVRYYVWGYMDNTKCCDYQWEIVPKDTKNLPSNGSLVSIKGTFNKDDKALDKYWITDSEITVTQEYKGPDCDVDLTAMNGTLERVQIINMQTHKEAFEGKKVSAYGRIETPTSFQHPYYDNCFSQEFVTNDTIPAIGTEVIVYGTYSNGAIIDCTVTETNQY